MSVDANERPEVRIFTPAQGTPGAPGPAQPIAATVNLRKPDETLVQQLSLNATGGLDATLEASGAGPEGLWIVEVTEFNAHCQVEKLTGADRSIYATWVTAGRGMVNINVTSAGGAASPLPVHLRFTHQQTGYVVFEHRGLAGSATIWLIPGTYTVTATAPPGQTYSVNPDTVQFDLWCGKRVDLVFQPTLGVVLDTFPAINFVGGEAFLGRKGVEQRHSASATHPDANRLTFEWSFGGITYQNHAQGSSAPFSATDDGSRRPRKIFAEAMIEVEAILSDPDATQKELERAKDIAEAANRSDSNDPACMADPDREVFTGPVLTSFLRYFSCGGHIPQTYVRPRTRSGTTYTVDDSGGPSVDFFEIVDAVNASVDGDVIYVCPGTYTGDFEIPTAISVISFAGADYTFIKGDPANLPAYNVKLTADVLLQGFTIYDGGATTCVEGGGVLAGLSSGASPVIRQNKIFSNENCSGGAGITLESGGNPTVENNVIAGNQALNFGTGGILIQSGTDATIVNNVIAYNVAAEEAGSGEGPGGIQVFSGTSDIRNNILYCNVSDTGDNVIEVDSFASATIEYNNSFGNTDTTGTSQDYPADATNINARPVFPGTTSFPVACAPVAAVGGFTLLSGSLSIDAGDPDSAYNDVDGTTNDQGAYGGPEGDW